MSSELDITLSIIFWVLGFVIMLVMYKVPFFNNLRLGRNRYFRKIEYEQNPYSNLNKEQLQKIIEKMTTSFSIVLVIYGVLLTFMITGPLFNIVSWYFIIWLGWILAIIVRGGQILASLFDANETESETIRIIHDGKQFFTASLYLLVISIAFLPTFSFIDNDELANNKLQNEELETNFARIITSISIAIGGSFITFYLTLFRKFWFANISGYVISILFGIMLLGMASVLAFKPSLPSDLVSITLFNLNFLIPSVFHVAAIFGNIFFAFWLAMFANLTKHKSWIRKKYFKEIRELEKQYKVGIISQDYYENRLNEIKKLDESMFD